MKEIEEEIVDFDKKIIVKLTLDELLTLQRATERTNDVTITDEIIANAKFFVIRKQITERWKKKKKDGVKTNLHLLGDINEILRKHNIF